MMKTRTCPTSHLRFALCLLLLAFAPQFGFAQKTLKYDLTAFTEISLRNDAKLILKQDSVQSVTAQANEATLEKLIVEVKDRKLIIRYPVDTWLDRKWTPGALTIQVTSPQIDALTVSGPGSIVAETPVVSRILDFYVSGSGSIKLDNVKAEKITAMLSGSGHLQLSGKSVVSEFKMTVSGSGGVKASGLEAKNVTATTLGSGSCEVHATGKLVCKVAGSGNILYTGNPQIESKILGSGSVKAAK